MGLLFFPRGGSSHVAKNLATALPAAGWQATILSGSLSLPGRPGDARAFYRGLDVHTVDFTPALDAADPLAADPPFHPSYEDRADAPPAVSPRLGDAAFEHQVAAWARALEAAGAAEADVLHLHHLTPIDEAGPRAAPGRPGGGPPAADGRGAPPRPPGRPGGRPPARHRAADARGDRGRRAVSPRRRVGRADARLGGALPAPDRPLGHPGRPRAAAPRDRPGALRAGRERLRP